jgi:hypothetical protein
VARLRVDPDSLFLASAFVGVVSLLAFASVPQASHWFLLPVMLCGLLTGLDAADWLRGKLDVYDPVGILGLFGVHFFFLAPLLHVAWDYWMWDVIAPLDWRPWLGAMAALNVGGLLVYRVVRTWFWRKQAGVGPSGTVRVVEPSRMAPLLALALLGTALLQFWIYRQFGGVRGFVFAFEDMAGRFQGMGWLFSFSESFPILAFIAYVLLLRWRGERPSWTVLAIAIAGFFVVKMVFGGLRGSRSNTIWGLFWVIGIVHIWVRRVPKSMIYVGLVLMVGFMYFYGFYKTFGLEGLGAIESQETRLLMESRGGRTVESAILMDLGRADVQAFLLHQITSPDTNYRFAWGRTYLGSAALIVPRFVWPDRPATKVREGTNALYGEGTFESGGRYGHASTRVYGLAGEALLNFGIWGIAPAFAALGIFVAWVRRRMLLWPADDVRWLLFPLLVCLCLQMLVMDSDNLLFFTIKNGMLPGLVLWMGSRTRPLEVPGTADVESTLKG